MRVIQVPGLGQQYATGITEVGYKVETPTSDQIEAALNQLPVNSPAEYSQDLSILPNILNPAPSAPGTAPIGGLQINPWLIIAAVGVLAFAVAK